MGVQDLYNKELQQEKFAALVATRVAEIVEGNAKELKFEKAGGVFYTPEQETLLFADVIARSVVHYLSSKNSV